MSKTYYYIKGKDDYCFDIKYLDAKLLKMAGLESKFSDNYIQLVKTKPPYRNQIYIDVGKGFFIECLDQLKDHSLLIEFIKKYYDEKKMKQFFERQGSDIKEYNKEGILNLTNYFKDKKIEVEKYNGEDCYLKFCRFSLDYITNEQEYDLFNKAFNVYILYGEIVKDNLDLQIESLKMLMPDVNMIKIPDLMDFEELGFVAVNLEQVKKVVKIVDAYSNDE